MRTSLECVPCFVRQAAEAVELAVSPGERRERLLRILLREIAAADWSGSPPVVGQVIHRIIRRELNDPDPYRSLKERLNRIAAALMQAAAVRIERLPRMEERWEAVIRLAAAGNLLDAGAKTRLAPEEMHGLLDRVWHMPLVGDPDGLARRVEQAQRILYLTDNAGEIWFDRLLLEHLPKERVTVAVRGAPTLNDATIEDARACGLTQMVRVIGNGSDAPGTVLDDCSEEFRRELGKAELVISKGQGNFETLSEEDGKIWFLFTVKCEVVGRRVGAATGTLICAPRDALLADTGSW